MHELGIDRRNTFAYKAALDSEGLPFPTDAQIAQLVEQRTENPCVGGSNPPLGTILFSNNNIISNQFLNILMQT